MIQRVLGRSGIEVGAIGLGCWAIGGPFWRTDGSTREPMGWGAVDDDESVRAIHRGLELGVTLFDTSNNYGCGHSERILGRALAGRRDQVVIATKFGSVFDEDTNTHHDDRSLEMTPSAIGAELEGSLKRLNTEWVDLYLLHHGQLEPALAADAVDVLEGLVAEGKIRWYGWSTDDPDRARIFGAGAHCSAIEHRLSLSFDNPEMLAVCDELDLASVVRSPLNAGVLTGKFTSTSTFAPDDGRVDVDFSEGLGALRLQQIDELRPEIAGERRTMTQAALAWVLTRSARTIPIPGFKTRVQVEELVSACEHVPLSGGEMDAIERVFRPEVVGEPK